jgi:hypothetical protein
MLIEMRIDVSNRARIQCFVVLENAANKHKHSIEKKKASDLKLKKIKNNDNNKKKKMKKTNQATKKGKKAE